MLALLLLLAVARCCRRRARSEPAPAPRDPFFTSTMTPEEIRGKQAVLETSEGVIVLDLLADAAPDTCGPLHHAGSRRRVRRNGVPSRDRDGHHPGRRPAVEGSRTVGRSTAPEGLGKLRFEANPEKHTRGAVSAVLVPGNRDSAGNQFFIVVTDQPALDGQYTVFARVVDGINVAQKISTMPATNTVPGSPHRNPEGVDSRQAGAGAGTVRVSRRGGAEFLPSGR